MLRNTYYVLNLQTTGQSVEEGHRIVEFAAQKLNDSYNKDEFLFLHVNPEGKSSDEGALAVHQLDDEYLTSQLTFSAIAASVLRFLDYNSPDKPVLVMHNKRFIMHFLAAEMKAAGKESEWDIFIKKCEIIDTVLLAKKIHPKENSLNELAAEYNIHSKECDVGANKVDVLAQLFPLLQEKTNLLPKVSGERAAFFSPKPTMLPPAKSYANTRATNAIVPVTKTAPKPAATEAVDDPTRRTTRSMSKYNN